MQNLIAMALASLMAAGGLGAQSSGTANPRPIEHPRTVGKEAAPKEAAAEPKPTKPGQPAPNARKAPVSFRISGAEAWEVASRAGWKFTPKGGLGAMDGRRTAAQMHPGLNTSMVNGPRMSQMRTPASWGVLSQNSFFMFADASGRAKPLAAGWTVRGLDLSGGPFQWLVRPKAGASSPFFSIQITGQRSTQDTAVELTSLVLEGPADAASWHEAFAGR